jgi:hypothetical protein
MHVFTLDVSTYTNKPDITYVNKETYSTYMHTHMHDSISARATFIGACVLFCSSASASHYVHRRLCLITFISICNCFFVLRVAHISRGGEYRRELRKKQQCHSIGGSANIHCPNIIMSISCLTISGRYCYYHQYCHFKSLEA